MLFAELLGSTLPGDLRFINFTVTGSEANEVAMRMVAVQSTACGPIVKAFEAREREVEASENVTTEVHGVRVSNPIGGGPGELSGCAPDAAYARIGCPGWFRVTS